MRAFTSAGAAGSSVRSSAVIFSAYVDALRGLLDERRALVERAHQQPRAEVLQARRERAVVVVGPDRLGLHQATGPASRPAVRRMIATPVSASPAMIARSTGAAPRQRGSSDGWTLSTPKSVSSGSLISAPKAQTTIDVRPAAASARASSR